MGSSMSKIICRSSPLQMVVGVRLTMVPHDFPERSHDMSLRHVAPTKTPQERRQCGGGGSPSHGVAALPLSTLLVLEGVGG